MKKRRRRWMSAFHFEKGRWGLKSPREARRSIPKMNLRFKGWPITLSKKRARIAFSFTREQREERERKRPLPACSFIPNPVPTPTSFLFNPFWQEVFSTWLVDQLQRFRREPQDEVAGLYSDPLHLYLYLYLYSERWSWTNPRSHA